MKNTKELYRVDNLPIFQNRMYKTFSEAKACPMGNVRLVEDLNTGLVYNEAFCPELVKYDENYQNEQACSPRFKEHLENVAKVIERTIGKKPIAEVGCGKGFFMDLLATKGFDIIGFDPAYNGSNPKVVKDYFMPGLGINAEGILLRHVLEHIKDPVAFLQRLKEANGGKGKIYIEVPCFDWICEHLSWFDIFYEHVNYFRLSDFHRMFDIIYESGRVFGEQYIYVVADLSSLRIPTFHPNDRVRFPEDILKSLEHRTERPSAIWGGASKGVIFALLKEMNGQFVDVVIDINPAKQGKFLPGTGLRVQSPQVALSALPKGSSIYVMNSIYLNEIRQMSGNAYNYIGIDHE